MIKNAVFVILIGSFTSCSGGNGLHSEESIGSVQTPDLSNVDASDKVEAPNPADTNPKSSADESISPPSIIAGTYLTCMRIEDASLPKSEASVGCNIMSGSEKRALTPDTKVEWGYLEGQNLVLVFTESLANAEYHVKIHIKAPNEQDLRAQLPAIRITALLDGQALEPAIVASEVCGGVGDSCYNNTVAMSATLATTPSGKSIEYVISSGSHYVWKEVGGNRILKADGSDNWAKNLNTNGKGLSATDFTSYNSIVGRVCPPNVYIDDSNKFTTGNCLYYTSEAAQALNTSGTNGINGMSGWSTAKWYVGNIQVCSTKGMRLPTIFETSTTDTSGLGYYPTTDGNPTLAQSNGVPSSGYTWTASASTRINGAYFAWSASSLDDNNFATSNGIRCVLP